MGKPEDVEMPDGKKYLIIQGDEYLRFNEVTRKHEVVMQETIFTYEENGEILRDCYNNEVVLDYDADNKTIFEMRLKGRTDPDFPENPK